jgi:nitrogen regulatory protein P-II 1
MVRKPIVEQRKVLKMKKIEAIVREEKLGEIKDALEKMGVYSMTVFDVKGRGSQRGISLQWRAGEYRVDFLPKKMIMLVVKESNVQQVVDIICEYGSTFHAGDGKIFISTIDEVIRIRTREVGENIL